MKRTTLIAICMLLLTATMLLQYKPVQSTSAGAPSPYNYSGSPADGRTCTNCHSGTATALAGLITSTIPGTGYVPGNTYTITGSVSDANKIKFGFEMTPQNNAGTLLGAITITNATDTKKVGTKWVTHTAAGNAAPTHAKSWSFDWTAPASGTGAVTFYGTFVYANSNNSNSGDVVHTSTLTVQEFVAPTVSIALTSGTNPTCAGTNVMFAATPSNGGASPTYQWQVNGGNAGTGATFSSTTLTNGQTVTCIMTPTGGGSTVTSNTITMTVNPVVTPSLVISATSATTLCSGQSFSFSAVAGNGGSSPSYQWKVNGNNAGTGGTTFSSVLNNNDAVTCMLTSNANCASPTTATSNAISVTVTPAVAPGVTISVTSATTLCAGQSFSFSASTTNGGSSPSYQWKVNGNNAGTGGTTFSSVLNNNDAVTCVLTSNANCASPSTATSNSVSVTVNPLITPNVTISSTNGTNLCAGQSFSFSASSTNGGSTPTYQWKVNGNNAGTGGTTFSSLLNDADVVSCVLTSNASCLSRSTDTSNSMAVVVNPLVTPSIVISTPSTSICSGQTVSFTSVITDGGANPVYQWKVNGLNDGSGGDAFSTVLNNNDSVSCVLTSDAACLNAVTAFSNSISISVITSGGTPAVSVAASSNSVCVGQAVELTATPANGGSDPSYQWKLNGVTTGTDTSHLTITPNNGDSVSCIMTSNATCVSTNTANSNTVIIAVHPLPTPTISQSGNVLTSSAASTYQWYLNDTSINGANGQSFAALQSGNYKVEVTDSNSCSNTSSEIAVIVSGIAEVNSVLKAKIYPNPNSGSFTLEIPALLNTEVSIEDMYGRLVFAKRGLEAKENISIGNIAVGLYFVTVRAENKMRVLKMEVR